MTHMTHGDAARLLALAQTFDRRTVGETDAAAWADALHDLPVDECAEAIRLHYRETDAWLMPAHVRQRVKYLRNARADRTHNLELRRAIEAGKAVDRDRMRETAWSIIRSLRERLGEQKLAPEQEAALSVRCPYCAARPGRACINVAADCERATPHPSRVESLSPSA
jgi:hypothetical protein